MNGLWNPRAKVILLIQQSGEPTAIHRSESRWRNPQKVDS